MRRQQTPGQQQQARKDNEGLDRLERILSRAPLEGMSRYDIHTELGGGKERLNRLLSIGLEGGRFEKCGKRKGRNGGTVDLFRLSGHEAVFDGILPGEKNGLNPKLVRSYKG